MNARQKLFVLEYLKDLNAAQAAIRAGYSKKTARTMGNKLLTKGDIAAAVAIAIEERAKAVKVDAGYVLNRLAEIDVMSLSDILTDDLRLRPMSEWPQAWKRYISSIDLQEIATAQTDTEATIHFIKKLKWPDKIKNLELLGKHVDVQAFKDRVDVLHEVCLEELVTGIPREVK